MTKEQKIVARAVVQALFVKPSQHPETLRRKIAETYALADGELRNAAAMTPFAWQAFLLEVDAMLRNVGLSLRRGVESLQLVTAPVEARAVKDLLSELQPKADTSALTAAAHEVIAFLLLKETGTVAEIEKAFATDRRAVVDRLHATGWIEPRGERHGATLWAVAAPCLAHFNARSAAELKEFLQRTVQASVAAERTGL